VVAAVAVPPAGAVPLLPAPVCRRLPAAATAAVRAPAAAASSPAVGREGSAGRRDGAGTVAGALLQGVPVRAVVEHRRVCAQAPRPTVTIALVNTFKYDFKTH